MKMNSNTSSNPSRRGLLKSAAYGMAALGAGIPLASAISGCRKKTAATPSAGGTGPEVTDLKFGMIALTDCSPLVIAEKKGFFKKYGINGVVEKKGNWAAIRDSLTSGEIQGTHMLIGMPLSLTMGIGGAKPVPMVIPWLLNRNGQSISLTKALKGKVKADPAPLKPIVDAAKASGKPMNFAMTFPTGTHAMWIRYWLAAGGIHPDNDIGLKVVPPPNMFNGMQSGEIDGFCVGEPWNAKTAAEGVGYTAINTQDIWKDHPEKVLAFTKSFADANPRTVKAVLKAVHEASVWLDDVKNRPELCEIISATGYVNCPKELILGRLQGQVDYGDDRGKVTDPNYMIFSSRNCNYPQLKYAAWFISQFRRWGMVEGTPDYAGISRQVMRPDLYEEAMKEIGYTAGVADEKPETLFDNITFDPSKPEEYARSFKVHAMKG
ncbi:CmpA/NrtA family ABC transporter substrate-binding protein [Humisphaera borealis]|uniref:ABC transporter substrate-binding protein n=1 Tax=Humisphaera borealis TaxID=2807512 RepID=A0A7M2WW61_9BACT|nr:CmpA/NrtA family ABC transporter substrate-binding protein [Humisphaera borealis]QOV89554.1 ABC transporter substrate-binding protein [Humisphaera borealis]